MCVDTQSNLVNNVIKYEIKYLGSVTDLNHDDLYQVGSMALLKATENYKPGKASFETFAKTVIKNALLDYVRSVNRYNGLHDKRIEDAGNNTGKAIDISAFYVNDFIDRLKGSAKYQGTILKGVEAIQLRADGFNNEDIAEFYGVNKSCVSRWIYRASQRIKEDKAFLEFIKS